jgi:hypothetical protein
MQFAQLDRLSRWGLGIAFAASLAACGAADQSAVATSAAAPPSSPAPATAPPTIAAPTSVPATPSSAPAATTAPAAEKETIMPEPPSPEPGPDPPTARPARPTLQAVATPAAAGVAPTEQPRGDPGGVTVPQPYDAPLAAVVDQARADLAQRRATAIESIAVVEVRSVTWPDPGLGCPRPGMVYRQVPVDGLLIRLRAGEQVFSYHSGGGKPPFLCEQPTQEKLPPPGMSQ